MKHDIGGLSLDLDNLLFKLNLNNPGDDIKLVDLCIEKIKEYENPLVCLSGGYDSQFMCLLLKQAGIEFTAVTYETMWGLNVINSPDAYMAQNFAKKHDIPLQLIKLDFKTFLESEQYLEYAIKYHTSSPQIAYHLYFLDQIDYTDRSIVMGGDIPRFALDEDTQEIISMIHSDGELFRTTIIPYKMYAEENNIKMCKDLLFYTPELFYKSLENFANLVKKHNVIGTMDDTTTGNYIKELYYNNITEEDCETNLMSNTGFENIKLHFMSLSGDYDDFNNKYRAPLMSLLDNFYKKTYGITFNYTGSISQKISGFDQMALLIDDLQDYYENNSIKLIKHYKLEF